MNKAIGIVWRISPHCQLGGVMASVVSFLSDINFQNTNKIMIKANELRIGNLILFDCKITHVNTRNIAYISNSNRLKNGDAIAFEPIELTEEWLLKAGFKKVGVNYQKDWILLWTYLKTGDVHFVLNEPNSNKRHITELQFVHQLQNLFFALEGSELVFSTEP